MLVVITSVLAISCCVLAVFVGEGKTPECEESLYRCEGDLVRCQKIVVDQDARITALYQDIVQLNNTIDEGEKVIADLRQQLEKTGNDTKAKGIIADYEKKKYLFMRYLAHVLLLPGFRKRRLAEDRATECQKRVDKLEEEISKLLELLHEREDQVGSLKIAAELDQVRIVKLLDEIDYKSNIIIGITISVILIAILLTNKFMNMRKEIKRLKRNTCEMPLINIDLPRAYVPEARMSGSELLPASVPQGQLTIAKIQNSMLLPIGQAFWIEDYLMTAGHVVSNLDPETSIILMNEEKGERIEMKVEEFEIPSQSLDIAVLKLGKNANQRMQPLKTKKMLPLKTISSRGVASISASGKGSFAPYEIDRAGDIRYSGSTEAGFSGAPYTLNGKVLGIHLGSISAMAGQIGYEINGILRILKRLNLTYKPESTSDIAMQEVWDYIDRVGNDQVEYKVVNQDFFQIAFEDRFGRRGYVELPYEEFDQEFTRKMKRKERLGYEEESIKPESQIVPQKTPTYEDLPSPSSVFPIGFALKTQLEKQQPLEAKPLSEELDAEESGKTETASDAQRRKVINQNKQILLTLDKVMKSLAGLESTHAQSREASPSTSKSSKTQSQKSPSRPQRRGRQ